MTKPTGKTHPEERPSAGPSPEEMQAAYQAHTLAQMLYGQLVTTHPWVATAPPVRGIDPMAGYQTAPWLQSYPGMWGIGPANTPFTAPPMTYL